MDDERGYSIAVSPEGDALYVGGIKRDSAMIIRMTPSGQIEWVRTFDVVPNQADHISKLLMDSEGWLVVSGVAGSFDMGGTVFAFRYHPVSHTIQWARSYTSTVPNYHQDMIELGALGNYLMSNNPHNPNNAELIELERNTGLPVGDALHYDLGSAETIYSMILHAGKLYVSGRFTDGGAVAEMRNMLMRLDPQTRAIEWIQLGFRPADTPARLYSVDLIVHDDQLISLSFGDDAGASIALTNVFLQNSTLDGQVVWIKRYDLPAGNDWANEIIATNDGYVVMCKNSPGFGPSDLVVFKIDYDGNLIWAKRYDFALNDNTASGIQSQILQLGNHLYFTAFAEAMGRSDMTLVRTDLNGMISDTCTIVSDINITVSDVVNPVFYTPQPAIFSYTPIVTQLNVTSVNSSIPLREVCSHPDTTHATVYAEICTGEDFEGYTMTGQYIDTFVTPAGCDSIRTLFLTVSPSPYTEEHVSICYGMAYQGHTVSGIYMDTLSSVAGCDSIHTLHLTVEMPAFSLQVTICAGEAFESYTQTGTYLDTLTGINGACDTLRTLFLTALPPRITSLAFTLCPGDTIFGYSTAGIYTDTLSSADGCDSIRILTLDIDAAQQVLTVDLCAGQVFEGYSESGTYIDTIPGTGGACDTLRTIYLLVADQITVTIHIHFAPVSPFGDTILRACTLIRSLHHQGATASGFSICSLQKRFHRRSAHSHSVLITRSTRHQGYTSIRCKRSTDVTVS
jgi:hypothetical protein